ncbi:hypothetical protein FO519_004278 [Halicephalobus sp. NKZ332]|nr:hypothetical protein FO519_004278 [Halicephalobus sp. NKZ332]
MRSLISRLPSQRTFLSRILSLRSASSTGGSTTKIPVPSDSSNAVYDEKSEMLQKIDIEDLPRAQKRFAKQFEKVNEERIKEIFAKNYKNHIAFGVLIVVVVGIYFYTMFAVKQETFLEEIDQEIAEERGEVPPQKK